MNFYRKAIIGGAAGAFCLLGGAAGAQTAGETPVETPAPAASPTTVQVPAQTPVQVPTQAATPTQIGAAKYLALCKRYSVFSGVEAENPNTVAYEMRGTIAGVAESGDGFIVLMRRDDSSTTNLVGAGPAPQLSVGTRVRALLKSQNATNDSGEVNLLALASEGEVAAEQLARKPKPKAATVRAKSYPNGYKKGKRVKARNVPLTSRSFSGTRVAPDGAQAVLDAYKQAIRYFNRRGSEGEIDQIARAVLNYSIKYQVDARLVMAVFAVESNFNPRARSHVGATGLGQLMPGTAAGLGVRNIYDIEQNVEGAVKYIRAQLDRYEGKDDWTRLQLALASYNAGPGAVKKYGGKVPPYRETQAYVRRVSAWFLHFLGERAE